MNSSSVAVVMPAYNEADGISGFLTEILRSFPDHDVTVVVVDDASTDATAATVEAIASDERRLRLVRSVPNAGHGPTTLKALREGLASGADMVVAVDGDGQFTGADLARVTRVLSSSGADIVEGVRTQRGDPLFRRGASAATRLLVRSRSGIGPRDANTPLRAYRAAALERIIRDIPLDTLTPNLVISARTRKRSVDFLEVPVRSLPRRGDTSVGSTWHQRRANLPSKRFLHFCAAATRQWFAQRI